jgi:curved DNA-binding protein CbpA
VTRRAAAGREPRDLYEALQVHPEAEPEVIQGAYRRLAQKYHPDRNPGSAEASRRAREINRAYQVLGDPERRAEYDRARRSASGPNRPDDARERGRWASLPGRPSGPGRRRLVAAAALTLVAASPLLVFRLGLWLGHALGVVVQAGRVH